MELNPPSIEEMQLRFDTIRNKGFPYIVATINDNNNNQECSLIGYAYANTFRGREGFNNTAEISIYLKHGESQKGIGNIDKLIHRNRYIYTFFYTYTRTYIHTYIQEVN